MRREHRIVVGIEGSGYAKAALVWALKEALLHDALVEVVTCYSPTYIPSSPDLGYRAFHFLFGRFNTFVYWGQFSGLQLFPVTP